MSEKSDDVRVNTGPTFKKGETVRHVDDPSVTGKVLEIKQGQRGPVVRISGAGNWIPAASLQKA